jgi:Transposase DDE domain group 1
MSSLRSIQRGTRQVSAPRQRPPLRIVADEPTLTPYGGGAVVGELCRRLRLVEGLDRAIDGVTRARAFKQRRRGASAGELLVSLAESMLVGGDAFNDIEDLRADDAGAELRAVPEVPAASTAAQLARRLRPSHLRAAEAALAGAGDRLDAELGREVSEPVTLDFDSTLVEVYGRKKPGASRAHTGQLAYQPLIGVWAERGRVLSTELLSGSDSTRADDTLALVRRTLALLPRGHGPVGARFDAGFYRIELLRLLRRKGVSFSISVPRSAAMWRALEQIEQGDWAPAIDFPDAEVAEADYAPDGWEAEPLRLVVRRVAFAAEGLAADPRARRRRSIPKEQLSLVASGEATTAYGYSFCLSDLPGPPECVEHHHRARAQIEERIKDHKLGVSLRRLPASDLRANRAWLLAGAIALNILAMLSDLAFGPDPDERLPRRRQAKCLRRMLLCVPARVIHHARQVILRLPAGLRFADDFARAYANARGLSPPAAA